MDHTELPLDSVIEGDCRVVMADLPEGSVDLVFADPPYNLQLTGELHRPNMSRVDAVTDAWDRFDSFAAYDDFTRSWLAACRRVLKPTGTLWVIGTYHCIHRIGSILQDLGFWILNDVVWVKTNPMPNFRGVRFTNAHETLIWAARSEGARYTFNHHAVKAYNDGKQARSDWRIPVCAGRERIRRDGRKAHSTQKPEELLERVIVAASRVGDVVLDPFVGSGTTAAVAKRLRRRWIGIERESEYAAIARARVEAVHRIDPAEAAEDVRDTRRGQRGVPFAELVAKRMIKPGGQVLFRRDPGRTAIVTERGGLLMDGTEASIHRTGSRLMNGAPCNGWEHWYYRTEEGALRPIDDLRAQYRAETMRAEEGGQGEPGSPQGTGACE